MELPYTILKGDHLRTIQAISLVEIDQVVSDEKILKNVSIFILILHNRSKSAKVKSLGYRTALTDIIFKGDHLRIIQTKLG